MASFENDSFRARGVNPPENAQATSQQNSPPLRIVLKSQAHNIDGIVSILRLECGHLARVKPALVKWPDKFPCKKCLALEKERNAGANKSTSWGKYID